LTFSRQFGWDEGEVYGFRLLVSVLGCKLIWWYTAETAVGMKWVVFLLPLKGGGLADAVSPTKFGNGCARLVFLEDLDNPFFGMACFAVFTANS
jgi:hypothetical protein